jgi:lipid II:glycine glycyltransferase (peptidoglycan interpeptide bridge formation enzyme)
VTRFNLGGVPHDAMHDGHAEHGVYRFKRGFGTDRRCRLGASGAL